MSWCCWLISWFCFARFHWALLVHCPIRRAPMRRARLKHRPRFQLTRPSSSTRWHGVNQGSKTNGWDAPGSIQQGWEREPAEPVRSADETASGSEEPPLRIPRYGGDSSRTTCWIPAARAGFGEGRGNGLRGSRAQQEALRAAVLGHPTGKRSTCSGAIPSVTASPMATGGWGER